MPQHGAALQGPGAAIQSGLAPCPPAMDLETLGRYLPHKVIRRRVREAAVRRVRKDLILAGKSESELSTQDLEYLLADAEKDVLADIKQTGLLGALALLGINLF